ncbi:hypothetical protein [Treponema peruense]|uniref:Asp23 family, cell envelope-related function n=1 Tax=Treponema peruense TaxID=2787628 RepID=A0A7T3RFH0_9SPIR|nr:hypothetical protein [Treponema peruense]QQA02174.1 hypothetical protein IWA51_06255 [Treponema peruense]
MNIFSKLSNHGITVFALVGESGTGKSFRAKLLAQKYGINALIDDGLLIQDDKILAGRTAKHEKTYMGAVRIALFDDKQHRDEVARVLQKNKIKKILILGTSEKMVGKIAMRLQLPPPSKIIKIEDISTREEIEKAIRSRQIEGKHVIPVPAIEVKKSYSQIFYKSIREILSKGQSKIKILKKDGSLSEKSIVTPEFSKKGRIEISEAALSQMAMHCVSEFDSDIRVKKLTIKTDSHGYRLIITIDVPFGKQLTGEIHNLQQYIIENIERFTGILVEEVSIIIDKITGVAPKETKQK